MVDDITVQNPIRYNKVPNFRLLASTRDKIENVHVLDGQSLEYFVNHGKYRQEGLQQEADRRAGIKQNERVIYDEAAIEEILRMKDVERLRAARADGLYKLGTEEYQNNKRLLEQLTNYTKCLKYVLKLKREGETHIIQ